MKDNYEDILYLERPISKNHIPLPKDKRASQFMPFAALTGYSEAVEEKARITKKRIELDEEALFLLDQTLEEIKRDIHNHPKVSVTYFVPDNYKEGGEYINLIDFVKRIDEVEKCIYFLNHKIKIDTILKIEVIS